MSKNNTNTGTALFACVNYTQRRIMRGLTFEKALLVAEIPSMDVSHCESYQAFKPDAWLKLVRDETVHRDRLPPEPDESDDSYNQVLCEFLCGMDARYLFEEILAICRLFDNWAYKVHKDGTLYILPATGKGFRVTPHDGVYDFDMFAAWAGLHTDFMYQASNRTGVPISSAQQIEWQLLYDSQRSWIETMIVPRNVIDALDYTAGIDRSFP